ncbi:hypothetical protein SBRCBS47491_007953, partial [Sporothrix bragantina]
IPIMSRLDHLASAFPPTPEDEESMKELRPGGGHAVLVHDSSSASSGPSTKLDVRLVGINKSVADTPTSPFLSSALSRFEFETGKGNEGTKVLLVEWDGLGTKNNTTSESTSAQEAHDWEVSWEGRAGHNILAASETAVDVDDVGEAGRRGVLHTLWAKQRLASLAAEIEAEMKANSESIGLQIALQEQEWVTEHFGVGPPTDTSTSLPCLPSPESPTARIAMPRSPIGGKLGEKLRGLKLATSPADLAAAFQFKPIASTSITRSAQATNAPRPAVFGSRGGLHTSIEPYPGAHSSLDAVIQNSNAGGDTADISASGQRDDVEDELFALPLSPRSPEMARSPFSLL